MPQELSPKSGDEKIAKTEGGESSLRCLCCMWHRSDNNELTEELSASALLEIKGEKKQGEGWEQRGRWQ